MKIMRKFFSSAGIEGGQFIIYSSFLSSDAVTTVHVSFKCTSSFFILLTFKCPNVITLFKINFAHYSGKYNCSDQHRSLQLLILFSTDVYLIVNSSFHSSSLKGLAQESSKIVFHSMLHISEMAIIIDMFIHSVSNLDDFGSEPSPLPASLAFYLLHFNPVRSSSSIQQREKCVIIFRT